MTAAALKAALNTSHRTMPNLVVKDDDADSIIAYILSLSFRPPQTPSREVTRKVSLAPAKM